MNGRQARRQRTLERDRVEQILDEASRATPEHVGTLPNGNEVWVVGPIGCVIPPLLDEWPDDLKHALDRRRRATLTGRCDCGARRRWLGPNNMTLTHEANCPASDPNLIALGFRHGVPFGHWI
ncbi:hypothetical protein ABZW11_04940 [Nonomuraea sp. NPDC004580]|uniref:hypothetical protein n=1 Tax=Nonomuraea sp. NPDC004580 TaxID=3154552 RepID=UPI0033A8B806